MAFLCPSRLGKVKAKRGYYNPVMGRITGSDSIETLVKLELGKQNANNPETRRIILQSFTGCAPEEISVKQGQKVHILYREGDWAYVLTHDKKQGYVPFTFCARIGKAPSYRAPKLNKDTEMLLENDEIGVNDEDDDEIHVEDIEDIDTTLAEPPEGSYYSEFVSDSFVSDELSEQNTAVENVEGETIETEHNENEPDNQYSESVTIVLDTDDENNEHPEPESEDGTQDNSESLEHSVVPNTIIEKRNNILNSQSKIMTEDAFKTTEKRPEIVSAHNNHSRTVFNTKMPLGRYLVLYDFEGHYEDDARVRQADIVTVLNMDDTDWYWVRKADFTEGFVPSNFLFRLGLLTPDAKDQLTSISENPVTEDNVTTDIQPARNSENVYESANSLVEKGAPVGHHAQTSFENHKSYIPAKKNRNTKTDNSSGTDKSNPTPLFTQNNLSSPTMGSLSPRYCNFSFETNQKRTSSHRGANYSENSVTLQDTEELYPPPLEFSNSTIDSFEGFHDTNKPGVVENNYENHMNSKYSNHGHMRNNSQPVSSLNTVSPLTLDLDGSGSPQGKLYTKNQNAQVRYRTDSNGKRVSKNKARPKSTPPGDLVLQTSQYYMNDNQNQHNEPQNSSRLSGHQSERLTPRTNCNYSPTYHSSVWKPYQSQRNSVHVPDSVPQYQFAKGHSAFENPKSNRYSMYAYTNLETYADDKVPKSCSPNVSRQEALYYPSGVHNIRPTTDSVSPQNRSTKDNSSPQNVVQNAIRKLSDEENQNLFRKLDSIQNSFDGDDPIVNDTKSNKNEGQYTKSNHHAENGRTERPIKQSNDNEKNSSNTSSDQKQDSKDSIDRPSFNHKTRKSYKIATQGAELENKTSHIKHIVHSYSPVEGSSTEEINNTNKRSKDVKHQNAEMQSKRQSTGYFYAHNMKLNNLNTLYNGMSQVKQPDQKELNQIKPHQQKWCDINMNNKQNQNNHRKNGTTQMTELISQFDYNATSKSDLPLEKGEVVQVSLQEQDSKHWYWAYSPKLKRHGYVPRNYVQAPQITMI